MVMCSHKIFKMALGWTSSTTHKSAKRDAGKYSDIHGPNLECNPTQFRSAKGQGKLVFNFCLWFGSDMVLAHQRCKIVCPWFADEKNFWDLCHEVWQYRKKFILKRIRNFRLLLDEFWTPRLLSNLDHFIQIWNQFLGGTKLVQKV